MTEVCLRTENIKMKYGGVRALDGVSIKLSTGEIKGLIGPNGSGKSTLIDVISARRRPIEGRVLLFEKDITGLDAPSRRLMGLSRSFQRTTIFPALTVAQHMRVACAQEGSDRMGIVLQALSLDAHLETVAAELSYGEQRRLDLALALVGQPKVLLLDEPAAGLSREESMQLATLLRDLVRQLEISVLLVEHDMEVVFGVSDSITVLETGQVLAEGLPAEIRADERVRTAYLGSEA